MTVTLSGDTPPSLQENLKHSVISSTSCGHFGEQPLDTALERADLLYQHRIEAEQLSLLTRLRTQQQLPTGPQLNDLYLHLSVCTRCCKRHPTTRHPPD